MSTKGGQRPAAVSNPRRRRRAGHRLSPQETQGGEGGLGYRNRVGLQVAAREAARALRARVDEPVSGPGGRGVPLFGRGGDVQGRHGASDREGCRGESLPFSFPSAETRSSSLQLPSEHLSPDNEVPTGGVQRPKDAHLDNRRLKVLSVIRSPQNDAYRLNLRTSASSPRSAASTRRPRSSTPSLCDSRYSRLFCESC